MWRKGADIAAEVLSEVLKRVPSLEASWLGLTRLRLPALWIPPSSSESGFSLDMSSSSRPPCYRSMRFSSSCPVRKDLETL